jgi:hypothetical protein
MLQHSIPKYPTSNNILLVLDINNLNGVFEYEKSSSRKIQTVTQIMP